MTPEEYTNKPFVKVTSQIAPPINGEGYGCFYEHLDGRMVFYARGYIGGDQCSNDCIKEAFRLAFDEEHACRGCVGESAGGQIRDGKWIYRHGTTSPRRWTDRANLLCEACRYRLAEKARMTYLLELKRLDIDEGEIATLTEGMEPRGHYKPGSASLRQRLPQAFVRSTPKTFECGRRNRPPNRNQPSTRQRNAGA